MGEGPLAIESVARYSLEIRLADYKSSSQKRGEDAEKRKAHLQEPVLGGIARKADNGLTLPSSKERDSEESPEIERNDIHSRARKV